MAFVCAGLKGGGDRFKVVGGSRHPEASTLPTAFPDAAASHCFIAGSDSTGGKWIGDFFSSLPWCSDVSIEHGVMFCLKTKTFCSYSIPVHFCTL